MKKQFLTVAVAALALAGCSKNETVEVASNRAIGFESFVGKSTRVTEAEDLTQANIGTIGVYGWRTKTAAEGEVTDELIFNNTEVSVAENGTGSYSDVQYWEAGYTYNFEAVAPYNKSNITMAANKDGGQITFTNDGTTDLLYAKATEVDLTDGIVDDPGAVNFNFSHLLSRVKFTFENTFPANAAAKITVSNVKITNAIKSGKITLPSGDWTMTAQDLNLEFPVTTSLTDIAAGNGTGETEHMYMIPGESKTYTITFDVLLKQGNVSSSYSHTVSLALTLAKGNSYNLKASLGSTNVDPENPMYEIKFTAEVGDWGEFGEPVVVPVE